MRARLLALPFALLAAFAMPSQALAKDGIAKAENFLADLRFEEAQDVAQKALKEGKLEPGELVKLYLVLGKIAASMGNESEATAAFLSALSIDREVALPEGVSPKLTEPFDTARARLEGAEPFAVEFEQIDTLLLITVSSDPGNLVGAAEVRFTLSGSKETRRAQGREKIELLLPKGAKNAKVSVLDLHGNRLTKLSDVDWDGGKAEADVATSVSTKSSDAGSVAIYERWEIYAGLAVGAALGGAYLGKTSQDKIDQIEALEDGTEFSVAQAMQDKAERRALYANLSFVGAGLLAGTAYWMYSRSHASEEPEKKPKTTAVFPIVGPQELGVSATLRF